MAKIHIQPLRAMSSLKRRAVTYKWWLCVLSGGKFDVGYSLHVYPSSFSTSGLQTTDFLANLGFDRSDACSFTKGQQCYVIRVHEEFDPEQFLAAFLSAFGYVTNADNGFENCGFLLPKPEGWGFFHGKPSGRSMSESHELFGDGHTAHSSNCMKQTEDDNFFFRFSFITTEYGKGFVTHYRPKHPPLSSEIASTFQYLGLQQFPECPEFEFEQCFYRKLAYEEGGGGYFDSNTEYAHRTFDAHASHFSSAISDLLKANAEIESFGMSVLPFDRNTLERLEADIEQKVIRGQRAGVNTAATAVAVSNEVPFDFDVAISVAGADKEYAKDLAERVGNAGFSVFYYEYFPEYLWGKNLAVTFDQIFRQRSRFCVIFVSEEYSDRVWTIHELRSALARAIDEKGTEYILPVRIDQTELEGLLPTTGYLPINIGIEKIGELLIKKLKAPDSRLAAD